MAGLSRRVARRCDCSCMRHCRSTTLLWKSWIALVMAARCSGRSPMSCWCCITSSGGNRIRASGSSGACGGCCAPPFAVASASKTKVRTKHERSVFTASSVEAPESELRHAAQQLITGEVEQEVGGRLPPHGREIDLQANAVALAPERDDCDGHHDDDGGDEPQGPASRPSRSPGACGSNGRSERRRAGCIFPA